MTTFIAIGSIAYALSGLAVFVIFDETGPFQKRWMGVLAFAAWPIVLIGSGAIFAGLWLFGEKQ